MIANQTTSSDLKTKIKLVVILMANDHSLNSAGLNSKPKH